MSLRVLDCGKLDHTDVEQLELVVHVLRHLLLIERAFIPLDLAWWLLLARLCCALPWSSTAVELGYEMLHLWLRAGKTKPGLPPMHL